MLYYLEHKQFKPSMIFHGVLMIPWILALMVVNILFFELLLLIILIVILLIYFIVILVFWKASKRKNHYLLLKDDGLEISFFDSFEGEITLNLQLSQVIKLEYYRINSIKGWLTMFFSYIFPKCVFVTYNDGKEQTKFIGYLDKKDITEIAHRINAELIIH